MSDEPEYELVMPFVVVESKGGPYDDDAFAAGWSCADLDHDLARAARIGAAQLVRSVRTETLPQVDLIAMKHGYAAAAPQDDPDCANQWTAEGWSVITFTLAPCDG